MCDTQAFYRRHVYYYILHAFMVVVHAKTSTIRVGDPPEHYTVWLSSTIVIVISLCMYLTKLWPNP